MMYCVYYENRTYRIIEFFPEDMDSAVKNNVMQAWNQDIPRKILIELSMRDMTMQELKSKIGHSNSTLHENILKLEGMGLLKTEIVYKGNKVRKLSPTILFVTKNVRFKERLRNVLNEGLWVDSDKSKVITEFLDKNPDRYYTVEEISAKTKIPVDEIQTLLTNWESNLTRAFSDFLKQKPFERKILYRSINSKKKK